MEAHRTVHVIDIPNMPSLSSSSRFHTFSFFLSFSHSYQLQRRFALGELPPERGAMGPCLCHICRGALVNARSWKLHRSNPLHWGLTVAEAAKLDAEGWISVHEAATLPWHDVSGTTATNTTTVEGLAPGTA